jgi:hypothetical protein
MPLLTELETVDDEQAINISLLKELSSSLRLRRTRVISEGSLTYGGSTEAL